MRTRSFIPLEEAYFGWLSGIVTDITDSSVPTRKNELLRYFHRVPYVWVVWQDENLAFEAITMREQFLDVRGEPYSAHSDWLNEPVSFLEAMVGFVMDMLKIVGGTPSYWFWHCMDNLQMYDTTDWESVDKVLETFMTRTYSRDGSGGGMFPLYRPKKDQRKVDLWMQFNFYAVENRLVPDVTFPHRY